MTAPAITGPEALALELERSADYRVLRRFTPDPAVYVGWTGAIPDGCKTGLFLDLETTGLDTKTDHILELGLVPFVFDADGVIYDVGKGLSYFNDPGVPVPPRITELTGITQEMVAGRSIDTAAVRALVDQAVLIVAHHADYDRKIAERALPFLRDVAWACSHKEIPWEAAFGCRAAKLAIVLEDALGQFSDNDHRAVEDCHIGVNLLANAKFGGRTALGILLESARQPSHRVWAVGSPFGAKDKLRERGYFWDADAKCWYRDVPADQVADESMFARDIGGATPRVAKYTAKDRYSVRVR